VTFNFPTGLTPPEGGVVFSEVDSFWKKFFKFFTFDPSELTSDAAAAGGSCLDADDLIGGLFLLKIANSLVNWKRKELRILLRRNLVETDEFEARLQRLVLLVQEDTVKSNGD